MKISPIIGLEIHIQLNTQTKAFCPCLASYFKDSPNTHTCPVCLGLPGALPLVNQEIIKKGIIFGLSVGADISLSTHFDRKNYFYPDLPKGYQISQFYEPLIKGGQVKIGINGQSKVIRISEAHLEEDAAKSIHEADHTLVDYNKSGVPLLEIVSHPDLSSSEEVRVYAQKIQQIVRYLDISDANIEEGSMRVEPTVNLKIEDQSQVFYTPLVEIKNIASLSAAAEAVDYEIDRQTDEFKETKKVKSATNKTTRGYDMDHKRTFLQREKEGSADYRYFPEPDIPPVQISPAFVAKIKKDLPELPDQKRDRYQKDYQLSVYDALLLTQDRDFALAFEKALGPKPDPDLAKFVTNLFLGPLKKYLNEKQETIKTQNILAADFAYLFSAVQKCEISSTVAKEVILKTYQTQEDPQTIINKEGLSQVSDTKELEILAQAVIQNNPRAVDDYKKNPNTIGFLLGQLMRLSGGSANPQLARQVLLKLLS
jgi:aspartyl-tRNA(Asn)/glutamyl-tRNA(Gln) amidotransferase subunit B